MLSTLTSLLVAALPQAPQDFPTPRVIAGASNGEFRANGDFDRDGDVDLLHFAGSITGWTGVSIYENQGNGVLVAGPVTQFNFPASYTSGRLQPFVADFNGDTHLDFVIARDGTAAAVGEGLEFFFGDGNLGWTSRVLLPMTTPWQIAIGNIDADPAMEVAVAHLAGSQGMLSWVEVQSGTPVALPPFLVMPGVTPLVVVFAVADVDGDGVDDIAATTSPSSLVDRVTFFPTVAGTPTLGGSFVLPPQLQNINHRLLAGDLDGDGDRDLLFFKMDSFPDPGPWVQPFERVAGGWVQRPAQSVPTPQTGWFQPHNAQLLDWDGDGWLEVIAGDAPHDLLRSLGNWQYAQGFEVTGTGQTAGGGACDCDGDGYVDFVGGFSVLQGDGSFVRDAATNLPFATELVMDREGDGDVDLTRNGAGSLARNDGTGAFVVTQRFFPALGPNEHYGTPIAYADFDGDGRREFLAMRFHQLIPPWPPFTPLGMLRITDDRRDQFEAGLPATTSANVIVAPGAGSNDAMWDTGDVDGDGDVDLLLIDGYRENDGTGMLSTFVSGYIGRGRQVADVNGDGVPDVLTTSYTGSSTFVSIYLGGPGGFTGLPVTTVSGEADALLRDLDGDLDLDLMVATPGVSGLTLLENVGGTFVLRTSLLKARVTWLRQVAVDDFDGDGVPDLLLVSRQTISSGSVDTLTRYHGTGSNLGYVLVNEHLAPSGAAGFADVDGDGDYDSIGAALLRSRMAPAGSGAVRQYGSGTGGSAGITPLLGARGPIVSTSTADELRIVRGWPGANSLLVFGIVETTLPDAPLNGLVLHVGDPLVLFLPPLAGTPGVAGTGELTITLPNLPFLAGWTIVHQVFAEDPTSPSGWASSNGMAMTYGL